MSAAFAQDTQIDNSDDSEAEDEAAQTDAALPSEAPEVSTHGVVTSGTKKRRVVLQNERSSLLSALTKGQCYDDFSSLVGFVAVVAVVAAALAIAVACVPVVVVVVVVVMIAGLHFNEPRNGRRLCPGFIVDSLDDENKWLW